MCETERKKDQIHSVWHMKMFVLWFFFFFFIQLGTCQKNSCGKNIFILHLEQNKFSLAPNSFHRDQSKRQTNNALSLMNLFCFPVHSYNIIFFGETEGHVQVLWPLGVSNAIFHSSFSRIRTKCYAPQSRVNEGQSVLVFNGNAV